VVFFCRSVVCLCGFDFITELPKLYSLFVKGYSDAPFLIVLLPVNPFVFRAALTKMFSSVAHVLRVSSGAEICLSIVQAVTVYMIDEHIIRDFQYFTVHMEAVSFVIFCYNTADSVEC